MNTVEELVADLRLGKMVVLMDDEDRENEGDLIMAAECIRPEDINFMATYARGLICLTITPERCQQLNLPLMVNNNTSQHTTNFTVSIEASEGIATGISARDRALTVLAAVKSNAKPEDLVQPGHIFPVVAQPGGVMSRAGHTEAGCDLARLAGFEPASVIVEVMNPDGSMARKAELELFAAKHDLKIGTIADLIHYRATKEKTVKCIAQRKVQTSFGEFELKTYRDISSGNLHFVMIKGEIDSSPTLVRVQVMDLAGDLLSIKRHSVTGGKGWTYQEALQRVSEEGRGVVVLISRNETTQDIEESIDKLIAGKPTIYKSDVLYRQIGIGSQILRDLGLRQLRLMSSPIRYSALSGFNLEIVEYLSAKE